MAQFTTLTSRIVPLPVNDVDTDQIIPARFLKITDKAGLGANLFADWRTKPDGTPVAGFVLNDPRYDGAEILLAGHNFGCGSSREHAPWALLGFGIRAVVSTSFADIFCNNALKNGLLPVAVEQSDHDALTRIVATAPETLFTIDLASQTLSAPGMVDARFPIDVFSKRCLLDGVDELGFILGFGDRITAFEQLHQKESA